MLKSFNFWHFVKSDLISVNSLHGNWSVSCLFTYCFIYIKRCFLQFEKKESTKKDATKLEGKEQPVYRFKLKLTFDPKKTSKRNLGKWEIK